MKKIRIFSLVILVITVFVSLDLLINLLGSMIPTMNDGISTHSIIPGNLYFGNGAWSQERFFNSFLISSQITFLVFAWNIVITIFEIYKNKMCGQTYRQQEENTYEKNKYLSQMWQ